MDHQKIAQTDLYGVPKTTLITGSVGGGAVHRGEYSLLKNWYIFIGPWLLVCQFIEFSNQMELNGGVSNFETMKIVFRL